jgi:hypothetical protein
MTTQEFIQKTYNVPATKERRCSSVFTDYQGVVYSYGYHYPLAFNLKGVDFINVQGYSNTTSKHINWAQRAIGYSNYIGVKLWREEAQAISSSGYDEAKKLVFIKQALERELNSIKTTMQGKTRKNTMVYRDLFQQFNRVSSALAVVQELA